VLFLVALAFMFRLLVRVWTGESDYLHNGYTFYLTIAKSLLDGHGLCLGVGVGCGWRMPLYPLLIAPLLANRSPLPVAAGDRGRPRRLHGLARLEHRARAHR
jgi:hypothetical protein